MAIQFWSCLSFIQDILCLYLV
ncbi:hypothetical protein BLOT_016843 [Blomia tropicalis]|nr:hypothetical protein BLOT_016843 [Blomia tropicalis]